MACTDCTDNYHTSLYPQAITEAYDVLTDGKCAAASRHRWMCARRRLRCGMHLGACAPHSRPVPLAMSMAHTVDNERLRMCAGAHL